MYVSNNKISGNGIASRNFLFETACLIDFGASIYNRVILMRIKGKRETEKKQEQELRINL